ncbi:MAG: hypothetical protein L0H59_18550 [Tomitella sp.]|nr:hypothetical protein [Tomitella sp.]
MRGRIRHKRSSDGRRRDIRDSPIVIALFCAVAGGLLIAVTLRLLIGDAAHLDRIDTGSVQSGIPGSGRGGGLVSAIVRQRPPSCKHAMMVPGLFISRHALPSSVFGDRAEPSARYGGHAGGGIGGGQGDRLRHSDSSGWPGPWGPTLGGGSCVL